MNIPAAFLPAPFHDGELRAQQLAGGGPPGHAIRSVMPEQHRQFFSGLRFVLVAGAEADGMLGADVFCGAAGFVGSPDAWHLSIDLGRARSRRTALRLQAGSGLAVLGIDFASRRRNRVSGVIESFQDGVLLLRVRQSFGNCPKYIHPRRLVDDEAAAPEWRAPEVFVGLDREARACIAGADTFFVATTSSDGDPDISHRAGPAGFVRVDGDTLVVPDFRGNRYFNTLGNLLQEPRLALLFIDFATRDLLHLQGQAEIGWQAPAEQGWPAAERQWTVRVERGRRQRALLPLRWSAPPATAS